MIRRPALGALAPCVVSLSIFACAPADERPGTDEAAATQAASAEHADAQASSAEEAIRQLTADYEAAIAAGDLEGFVALFTDDAVIYPPDQPPVRGKEDLRETSKPFFDRLEMEETITYENLKVADDWAAGWYRYTWVTRPKDGGETSTEEGKGVALFRRLTDGSWKWRLSAWNRNDPPQEP